MKKLLIATILFLSFSSAHASHSRGGEILWKCISATNINQLNTELNANFTLADTGRFVFIAKLYGDCNGALSLFSPPYAPFRVNGSNVPSIFVGARDISPDCYSNNIRWRCGDLFQSGSGSGPLNGIGAVSEYIYRSGPVQLTGSPPANNHWTISITGIRNQSTNAGGGQFYVETRMYPYPDVPNPRTHGQNPPFKNMFPCYDNSPEFLELPNVVACIAYPFTYGPLAFDVELDSIVYEWGRPLTGPNNPMNFNSGYSFDNPLPSNSPSVGAQLDPVTGLITFESHVNGIFTTNVEAKAYKCGILVASVFRDVQIVTANCRQAYTESNVVPPENDPPQITFTPKGDITFTNTGNNVYRTTVLAGDLIEFTLNAQDFDLLPNDLFQTISFIAAGGQLGGNNWSDPNAGCNNPPCATIVPGSGQTGFVTSLNNTIDFSWGTDCNHLAANVGCGVFSNEYVFYLKMEDNFCPTPARTLVTVVIDVQSGNAPAPILECATKLPNGDVRIDFSPPTDTGYGFNYYLIEEAINPGGPYVTIDTLYDWNLNSVEFTPTGGSYYQMRTNTGCDYLSSQSRRIGVIDLNLTPIPPTNSEYAALQWNNPSTEGINPTYEIYAQYPSGVGPWVLVTTTTDTAYTDTVNVCGMDVNYKVECQFTDAQGNLLCESTSNDEDGYFSNQTNNDSIYINSVTVNENGRAEIDFEASPSGDVVAYYILYMDSTTGNWEIIDTVYDANNYEWPLSNAATQVESFKVISVDSCGNISNDLIVREHNTLLLDSRLSSCEGTLFLNWNAYEGWDDEVLGYEIVADIQHANGTVTNDQVIFSGDSSTLSYAYRDISSGNIYCLRVRALHKDSLRISESYPTCIDPDVPNRSEIMYISHTEVRGDGIYLRAFVDGTADVMYIRVERANDPEGPFYELSQVNLPSAPPYSFTYVDYLVDPNKENYFYRLVAVDSCSGIDTISNLATNILLKVEPKRNEQNWITWNPYTEFAGGVARYALYRSEYADERMELITDEIPATDSIFIDDIRTFDKDRKRFCYEIRAIEGPNPLEAMPAGFGPFRSISNIACITQQAKLLVPNAFNPSSTNPRNRTWGVRDRFVDVSNFELVISDRWGRIVFQTTNPDDEWDGGEASIGVYTYFIRFRSEGGLEEEMRGTITLIR